MMRILLLIGAGSFIGGICRYLLSLFVNHKASSSFPLGTLVVNIIGCFAIGLIFGWSERSHIPGEWRLFLATGICGGFTTFSAFSYETIVLFREGQLSYAFLYIAGSIIIGLLATIGGVAVVKL